MSLLRYESRRGKTHTHLEFHTVKASADTEHCAKLPNAVGPYCQLCVQAHLGEAKEGQILTPLDCSSINTLAPLLGRVCAMGVHSNGKQGAGRAWALRLRSVSPLA